MARVMKRYGNLFEKVVSIENIVAAHHNARRGKTHYREVKAFDKEPTKYAKLISDMLINETYDVGDYDIITKTVDSGKVRTIFRLSYFPHRVIHHAIIQVLEKIWTNTLIADTYCCIKGRGIHRAGEKIKRILRDDSDGSRYCLKLDIKKYYPNIDHDIMKDIIRKKIKDKKLLALIDQIIDSAPGLPIGNYLSQYLANLYLSEFDHYCKETLRLKYYFRYCDDIVIMDADKAKLHDVRVQLARRLKEVRLEINENWQVFPVAARGIDFLGYRYFHGYTLVRKRIAKKAFRSAARLRKQKHLNTKQFQSIISYLGWLKHANALNMFRTLYDDTMFGLINNYTEKAGIKNPLQGRVK